jgi:hypothetical protein
VDAFYLSLDIDSVQEVLEEREGNEDERLSISLRPLMRVTRGGLFCCGACASSNADAVLLFFLVLS